MIGALVAGLLAGYGIAIPVGAVGTYLVTLTARTSLKTGACAALGVATADGVYALTAILGGSALARAIEPIMSPLRWISALILVALAVRGGTTAVIRYRSRARQATEQPAERKPPAGPGRAYLTFWGITMLNPATVIYFAALVFGGQGRAIPAAGAAGTAPDHLDRALFVLAAFAASASWQLLLAGSGALLGRALTSDRGRLGTALTSSVLITALAIRLLA